MKFSALRFCLFVAVATSFCSQASALTEQTSANVFNGRPYLWLEAENFTSLGPDENNDGWKVVSAGTIPSTGGLPILTFDSNVSGTALLDDNGSGGHSDTALYHVQFITPGTYQLYTRHSMYDVNGNGNYGNEDSVYLSPAFNKNSASDWVDYVGLEFDEADTTVDVPAPGFALDPDGFKEGVGNSANDGWYAIRDWGVKSMGTVSFPNDATTHDWNGHFNWYNRPAFVSTNPAGGFDGEYGFKTQYVVTPEMVGQPLTFEIGTREPYGVFDGFLFIQDNNVDLLDMFSQAALDAGILPQPVNGDYNNNGAVDAADYVLWRNGGPLQNDTTMGVQQTDYDVWKANFGKTSGGGLSIGVGAVPEPASFLLCMIGMIAYQWARKRRGC